MRYFGKKYGYYPTDAKECYEVDKMSEDFYDQFDLFFTPMFCPPGPVQDGATEKAIAALAKMCKEWEPRMAKGQFLFGAKMMTIDFWFGALYTNIIVNPDCNCRDQWTAFLKAHPVYEKYGERFAAANAEYIGRRGSSPF